MTHPHADLEDLDLWRAVDGEIASLEQNRDLQLSTARPYVVGALCKRLIDGGLVIGQSVGAPASAVSGAAGTAAVLLRLLGSIGLLQAVFAMALQLWMLTKHVEGEVRLAGAAVGMAGLLFILVPSALLLWFAKPIGRLIARGL